MEEVISIQELESLINEFIERLDSLNMSKSALLSLQKTFHSKNITIQDWNTLIDYVQQNFTNLETLTKLMSSIADYTVVKPQTLYVSTEAEEYVIPEEDR